jgi:hypothetical protein
MDFNPLLNRTQEPQDVKKLITDEIDKTAVDIVAAIVAKFP